MKKILPPIITFVICIGIAWGLSTWHKAVIRDIFEDAARDGKPVAVLNNGRTWIFKTRLVASDGRQVPLAVNDPWVTNGFNPEESWFHTDCSLYRFGRSFDRKKMVVWRVKFPDFRAEYVTEIMFKTTENQFDNYITV